MKPGGGRRWCRGDGEGLGRCSPAGSLNNSRRVGPAGGPALPKPSRVAVAQGLLLARWGPGKRWGERGPMGCPSAGSRGEPCPHTSSWSPPNSPSALHRFRVRAALVKFKLSKEKEGGEDNRKATSCCSLGALKASLGVESRPAHGSSPRAWFASPKLQLRRMICRKKNPTGG